MPKQHTVLIRADANSVIGAGHVSRCLALAQEIQDRGDHWIFAAAELGALKTGIAAEGLDVVEIPAKPGSLEDAEFTAGLYRDFKASWLVADGYCFGEVFQSALRAAKIRTLLLDDYGQLGIWHSQLVLDQNLDARKEHYSNVAPGTLLLLGSRYVLLRREFRKYRVWQRNIKGTARNLLVTFGGGDASAMFNKVISALKLMPHNFFDIVLVVGPNAFDPNALNNSVADSGLQIRIETNATDMAALMSWADLAISAAGSTCWETCYLGLPALVFHVASNQLKTAQSLHDAGAVRHLGGTNDAAPEVIASELMKLAKDSTERERMSQVGRKLIDVRGAERVADILLQPAIQLRPVMESDCRILWQWANDAEVRRQSFTQEVISWPAHQQWFQSQLADSETLIRIAEDERKDSIGVVRFKLTGTGAVVSISLAPEFRGRGLASSVLNCALDELLRTTSVRKVSAFVKPENLASLRLFQRAGFICKEHTSVDGEATMHLVLQNSA